MIYCWSLFLFYFLISYWKDLTLLKRNSSLPQPPFSLYEYYCFLISMSPLDSHFPQDLLFPECFKTYWLSNWWYEQAGHLPQGFNIFLLLFFNFNTVLYFWNNLSFISGGEDTPRDCFGTQPVCGESILHKIIFSSSLKFPIKQVAWAQPDCCSPPFASTDLLVICYFHHDEFKKLHSLKFAIENWARSSKNGFWRLLSLFAGKKKHFLSLKPHS